MVNDMHSSLWNTLVFTINNLSIGQIKKHIPINVRRNSRRTTSILVKARDQDVHHLSMDASALFQAVNPAQKVQVLHAKKVDDRSKKVGKLRPPVGRQNFQETCVI